MATRRTSGRPLPNTVGAARYPLACARPAIPAPTTATPIDDVLTMSPFCLRSVASGLRSAASACVPLLSPLPARPASRGFKAL